MNWIQSLVAFLGRALLSIVFIASGVQKILNWQTTEQLVNKQLMDMAILSVGNATLQSIIEFGLTYFLPLLLLAVIFEILGGLLIFAGIWVRLGALLLIIFLIPTTLIFHHFWQLHGPDRDMQMVNFMKNVSILGGLLILLAMGKGCKKEKSHEDDD